MSKLINQFLRIAFLLLMVGCENNSFEALDCEWRMPDGYGPVPQGLGFWIDYAAASESKSMILRIEQKSGDADLGDLVDDYELGELEVSEYVRSGQANYSPGLRSTVIQREGYDEYVWIADEVVNTFLVNCD